MIQGREKAMGPERRAFVALFRKAWDGPRWFSSHETIDDAYRAAYANPGVYEMREIGTGAVIDENIDTSECADSHVATAKARRRRWRVEGQPSPGRGTGHVRDEHGDGSGREMGRD